MFLQPEEDGLLINEVGADSVFPFAVDAVDADDTTDAEAPVGGVDIVSEPPLFVVETQNEDVS